MSDTATPTFPPLFQAQGLSGSADPFAKACAQALLGCDAGLVVHNVSAGLLRAAIVFAPEVGLQQAMPVMIACGIGFQNALGALAPPEVAVHLTWQGEILINGAHCGHLRVASSHSNPEDTPSWIVVGLELPLIPQDEGAPGHTPDQTCLYEEGCVDVNATQLLEAWVRHTLIWINRLTDEGTKPLHAEWRGLAKGLGEEVQIDLSGVQHSGVFMGVDEHFGMLLRSGDDTQLLPLSALLTLGETA